MNAVTKRSLIGIIIVLLIASGLAFAGSQGGYTVNGFPLYALCILLAFVIQWIAFIPAYMNQTESFFDLTGGLTYIIVTVTAVSLSSEVDTRSYLFLGIILVWAVRLGSFLFMRIRSAG